MPFSHLPRQIYTTAIVIDLLIDKLYATQIYLIHSEAYAEPSQSLSK